MTHKFVRRSIFKKKKEQDVDPDLGGGIFSMFLTMKGCTKYYFEMKLCNFKKAPFTFMKIFLR